MTISEPTDVGHIPAVIDGWDYRSQHDARWATIPYSVTNDPEQTVQASGCHPVLQAVVLRNLCDIDIEPPELVAWNVQNRMRTINNGTKRASWNLLARQVGMSQEITEATELAMQDALATRGLLIVSLKSKDRSGLGTPSGHVVGIRSIDTDGLTKVVDVNNVEHTKAVWKIADILPQVTSRVRCLRATEDAKKSSRPYKASYPRYIQALLTHRG